MRYFTNVGPERGAILYRDHRDAIGVLSAPNMYLPVGRAFGFTWDHQGRQVYRLRLKNRGDLPGVWIVIDREFIRVEAQKERPRPSGWGPRPRC
jgi:hypothetical protein